MSHLIWIYAICKFSCNFHFDVLGVKGGTYSRDNSGCVIKNMLWTVIMKLPLQGIANEKFGHNGTQFTVQRFLPSAWTAS